MLKIYIYICILHIMQLHRNYKPRTRVIRFRKAVRGVDTIKHNRFCEQLKNATRQQRRRLDRIK